MFSATIFARTPNLPTQESVLFEEECSLIDSGCENDLEKAEDGVLCTAECSITYADGTTVTASAGNIFSSCERALIRCFEKLNKLTAAIEAQ